MHAVTCENSGKTGLDRATSLSVTCVFVSCFVSKLLGDQGNTLNNF